MDARATYASCATTEWVCPAMPESAVISLGSYQGPTAGGGLLGDLGVLGER